MFPTHDPFAATMRNVPRMSCNRTRPGAASIVIARYGDRTGMSNFEVCTNPAGGTLPPVLTLGANNGEGLSRRA